MQFRKKNLFIERAHKISWELLKILVVQIACIAVVAQPDTPSIALTSSLSSSLTRSLPLTLISFDSENLASERTHLWLRI